MENIFDAYGLKAKFDAQRLGKMNYEYVFGYCREYEAELSKDICEFTFEEFSDLIYRLINEKGLEIDTVNSMISCLKNYLVYCRNQNMGTFTEEILEKGIKTEFRSIKKWLLSMSGEIDYSINFISYNDLLTVTDSKEFSKQELMVYWLLFVGFNKSEIINFKTEDITKWVDIYDSKRQLPDYLIDKVSKVLSSADEEKSIITKNRYGYEYEKEYKNRKYLLRSTKGGDYPVSYNQIHDKLKKLEIFLNKSSLQELNMRKSGMLYIGSELLKNNKIVHNDELNDLVYKRICDIFNENLTTYRQTLDKIFNNAVLFNLYNIELPETIRRTRRIHTNLGQRLSPRPPKPIPRDMNDKEHIERPARLGAKGENLVLQYLKNQYDNLYATKDFYGYDIYAENRNELRCIEVKTMSNKTCFINITKNEYKVANSEHMKDYYWVYVVLLNEEDEIQSKPEIYAFKGFFDKIGLANKEDVIFRKESTTTDNLAVLTYAGFSLQLSDKMFTQYTEHKILDDIDNTETQQENYK